jgi:MSHA biogenesis protein MshO
MKRHHTQLGFTLIEAVIVIVVTGILVGIVAVFIGKPVQGYTDAVRRAELTDAADVALRRLSRDIHMALPNSVRVSSDASNFYLEFIPTTSGGRYRDVADGSTGGNFLGFTSSAGSVFDVLGAAPSMSVGDYVVVYNLGTGYSPADAYRRDQVECDATPVSPGCNIAQISAISGNTVTLDANPFAKQQPPLPSPNARFQVVSGSIRAVSYICPRISTGNLTRYWNYGFNTAQSLSVPATGSSSILVGNVICTMDYSSTANGRNGILYIQLTLSSSGESVTLFQQIHVDNAP